MVKPRVHDNFGNGRQGLKMKIPLIPCSHQHKGGMNSRSLGRKNDSLFAPDNQHTKLVFSFNDNVGDGKSRGQHRGHFVFPLAEHFKQGGCRDDDLSAQLFCGLFKKGVLVHFLFEVSHHRLFHQKIKPVSLSVFNKIKVFPTLFQLFRHGLFH